MSFLKRLKKPRASITLALPKGPFALGEEVKGTITVESEEDVDVNEILLKLVCWERKKKTKLEVDIIEMSEEPYWDEAVLYRTKRKVADSLSLTSGFKKEFPFSVEIPVVGRESYSSVDAHVKWYVVARMDVKGRKNISTHKIIPVTKTSTVQVTKEREVIKEIVMIPCKYCGGLMPQTATFCLNCGARRKA